MYNRTTPKINPLDKIFQRAFLGELLFEEKGAGEGGLNRCTYTSITCFCRLPMLIIYFCWLLLIKNVHWNCMGLYSVGKEVYLWDISGFRLFTRIHGLPKNMEGPKDNILMWVFLVGAIIVGTAGKLSVLVFLKVLKMKLNDF